MNLKCHIIDGAIRKKDYSNVLQRHSFKKERASLIKVPCKRSRRSSPTPAPTGGEGGGVRMYEQDEEYLDEGEDGDEISNEIWQEV